MEIPSDVEGPNLTDLSEYHRLAETSLQIEQPLDAINVASKGLDEHPDDFRLLMLLSNGLKNVGQKYQAAVFTEKALSVNGNDKQALTRLSTLYAELAPYNEEYRKRFSEVVDETIEKHPDSATAYANKAYVALGEADYEEAFKWGQLALKRDPENAVGAYNMGMAFLANHMWEEGWFCYNKKLDSRYPRGIPEYGVPMWQGEEDCTVIVCGEQGLGDEIMFASMVPDLKKHCRVILDVNARMAGFLGRALDCESHGTRFDNEARWKRGHDGDFWIPMGSLGAFYRADGESFTGEPYLTADPERIVQYKALLNSFSDKPKIGLSWTGGTIKNNIKSRSATLEELSPLLEYDAEWVSLQYKNTEDIPDCIHHWPRMTEGCDYEETAALIASLDLVISVTTTVIHCAGALGVETWCLTPHNPQWRYGTSGDRMPWYKSVELLRRDKGESWPIAELCARLERMGLTKKER